MKNWKCTVCGYIHQGEEPPDPCPVCGADKSMFELLQETPTNNDATRRSEKTASPKQAKPEATKKWRCQVCGYIHHGEAPPDQCPVCGADKSQFVPVEEAGGARAPSDRSKRAAKDASIDNEYKDALNNTSASSNRNQDPSPPPPNAFAGTARLLTRYHGHPIAVHIPNGLLPVSVLFTLLAVLLESASFATAARYNIIIVCLSMPVVVATGLIDWKNRFGGRITPVFLVKMICAGVVTLLSLAMTIWWIVNPQIYSSGLAHNSIFLLLNLTNVATAGVAGWYGGKLVFHE